MKIEDIETMIMRFNRDIEFNELRDRFNTRSIMDTCGTSRSETAHSAFLQWLLQGDDIIASAKDKPLMRFLDLLLKRDAQQGGNLIPEALKQMILNRQIDFSHITVENEYPVSKLPGVDPALKKCKDRLDLYLTADFINKSVTPKATGNLVMVIENKVDSQEGTSKRDDGNAGCSTYRAASQTMRYLYAVQPQALEAAREGHQIKLKQVGNTYYLFVYLTPLSSRMLDNYSQLDEEFKPGSPNYIQINYQDIADDLLHPYLSLGNQSTRSATLLADYLNNLTVPGSLEEK